MKKSLFINILIIITCFIFCILPNNAISDELQPILKVDTGGHMSYIRKMIVSSNGKYLISASDDKTIRVWDTMTKKETRKILGHIATGSEGVIYSIALSPDDKYLVAGGKLTGNNEDGGIRIYDFKSGRLLKNLKAHSRVVSDLHFSEDGRFLTSCSDDDIVEIWDINSSFKDESDKSPEPAHIFKNPFGSIHAVRIFKHRDDYRIVTVGYTNMLYSLNEKKMLRFNSKNLQFKFLAVSNHYIAISGEPYEIEIFDLNLKPIKTIKTDSVPTGLSFSPDSKLLLAGSNIYNTENDFQKLTSFKKHNDTTSAVVFLNNTTAITAGESSKDIYFWDTYKGEEKGHIVGDGQTVYSIAVIGNKIAIGNTDPCPECSDVGNRLGKLEKSFDLETFTITIPPDLSSFKRISTQHGEYSLKSAQRVDTPFIDNMLVIKKREKEIAKIVRHSDDGYRHNAFSFTKDGIIISGGANGHLIAYNVDGEKLADFIGHTGEITSIAVDGDRLVSGSTDQTIMVWNLKELKEEKSKIYPILNIYISKQNEWVIWTTEGFFNTSRDGAKYIGYHINQGPNKEAQFISVDKLYNTFYRPDLIETKLQGKEISTYTTSIKMEKILQEGGLPPKVEFITQPGKSEDRDMMLKAKIYDTGGGIGDIILFLDEMPISMETGGRAVKIKAKSDMQDYPWVNLEKLITLQNGINNISLIAYNKTNTIESQKATIQLTCKTAEVQKPDLHILTIAINNYRDGDLRLKYSIADADAIINTLQEKAKSLFDNIYIYKLFDDSVNKDIIEKRFDEISKKTRREDVFILYLAGHGITFGKDSGYYYLPVNFRFTSEESIAQQGISMHDFTKYLSSIQATKSLLLLDTCNSGSFVEAIASRGLLEKTAINKLMRAVGRATLVASSKDQIALEGYEGHGVFTYVVLEGLKGKAADKEGKITINRLTTFVEELLPQITYKKWGYEQIPQKSLQGMDFPIAAQ